MDLFQKCMSGELKTGDALREEVVKLQAELVVGRKVVSCPLRVFFIRDYPQKVERPAGNDCTTHD
jgi:hypothetical protein